MVRNAAFTCYYAVPVAHDSGHWALCDADGASVAVVGSNGTVTLGAFHGQTRIPLHNLLRW